MKIHLYPQSWRLSLSKHSHNLLRSRKNNSPFFKTSICLSWSALLSSSRHSAISPSIEPYSWVCTMILKSSSTFRSGDEKFSVSRRRDHNSLLSSLCRWCIKAKGIWGIQDIVCATENDSRRNNRSYNPSAILSGIAPRRSRVLDSKYALTSLWLVSHVVCCPLVYSSKYITVQLAIWHMVLFLLFFSLFQHMHIIMPYAMNMHKSTHNIIRSIKEFGANVTKTSRLVLNCTSQTIWFS